MIALLAASGAYADLLNEVVPETSLLRFDPTPSADFGSGDGYIIPPTEDRLQFDTNTAPPLPGIYQGDKPKLILAQDINYPPYAYLQVPPEGDYTVGGFGNDIAKGLESVCDIEVVTVESRWSDCWSEGAIGQGLLNGHAHSCMTYTHTAGERNRFVEFSNGILQLNKPAGLLVKLANGKPTIDGMNDMSGKKVIDVTGWAPTSDTLALVENKCTGERFTGFEMITPDSVIGANQNDVALEYVLDGRADAMWIYADQADHYKEGCDNADESARSKMGWNCDWWMGFGTEFAYVQTGLFNHAVNGTTLTMSRKGSGVNDIVNPCLERFMKTEAYHDICQRHHVAADCYPNEFFTVEDKEQGPWMKPTSEHPINNCANGYCSCSELENAIRQPSQSPGS
jgi:hypothetical protein